ncbi:glycoside hydrolase superfamily [Ilyonectria sp. MPI-CAGE-AT-0026]|nr:glycoside hydrolase superfamily [Ilyonectria sp. MPI-CAGE-AT-0026]
MEQPTDSELRALLAQLELPEKLAMLAGRSAWETHAIDRLAIPSLRVSDGPNGARGSDFFNGKTAACFPACVSIAATFNQALTRRVGKALGQETQTKGSYVLLGPTVCPHRSPLGGRNFESFSEDPLLTGLMASEYVKGLQSERVGATVKHFAVNEQDTKRFTVNETVSERALREIYLRPFEITVKNSDPWCIMTSYPKVNGAYIDAQPTFIQNILRGEWGFKGLVMSDWGAVSNSFDSVKYGLDLEMPGPTYRRGIETLTKGIQDGLLDIKSVDDRVFAILKLLQRTGKFADRREAVTEEAVNTPEHRALIREAGGEGIVLLKNAENILPINPKKARKIALLGPLAKTAAAHGGGSASLSCHYKISPYDAFKQRLGSDVEITSAKGAHIFRAYPDIANGLVCDDGAGFTATFFNSANFTGTPFYTKLFPVGNLISIMDEQAVGAKAIRFNTTYHPPRSGHHYLSFSGIGPSKLFIDKVLVHDQVNQTKDSMDYFLGVQEEARFQFAFDSTKKYDIVIETIQPPVGNCDLHLMANTIGAHLGFIDQAEMETDLLAEAVELAKDADLAICFVGNSTQWETEGQDIAAMVLPSNGSQDALISGVAAANANTIVVNTTGVAVEMPWLDKVPAVLQAWYAGQETGNAVLDVLLGEVNPSGKLPISWPRKYEHTACYGNFGLDSYDSLQVDYVEGVNVGYRHFDQQYGTEKEVLFPFGYGQSYTSFELSDATISGNLSGASDVVTVSVSVTNTGSRAGAETMQVYVAPPKTDSANGRPPKALVAFSKVFLQPGESKTVSTTFGRDCVAYWDDQSKDTGNQWKVDAGAHEVLIATSSKPADVKSKLALDITKGFHFAP